MGREYRFSARDHMDAAAAITGIEGWTAYRWENVDGGAIITGCVPSGFITRGPRKGEPKFKPATPGTERRVAVGDTHMHMLASAYETENGRCWDCKGDGLEIAGWSREGGTRWRTCRRCDGTGKPAGETA